MNGSQSIEEVSGNINRARSDSTKTDEINTIETGSAIKTQNVENSKKVTFESKDGEAEERKVVVEAKEEGNSEPKGQKASKSNNVKVKRKE